MLNFKSDFEVISKNKELSFDLPENPFNNAKQENSEDNCHLPQNDINNVHAHKLLLLGVTPVGESKQVVNNHQIDWLLKVEFHFGFEWGERHDHTLSDDVEQG